MIAPQGADSIHLKYLVFDMSPDYMYNVVFIDVCQDVACTSSRPLSGSPFQMNPNSSPVREIASSSTGFVRVRFQSFWSGHTQARFVLYYSTYLSTPNNVSLGLMTSSWHFVSAVVESINDHTFKASIYVNGTLFAGPVYSLLDGSTGVAFAGQSGIALGRNYPMSAPFGYFMGSVDELIVMDRIVSGDETILIMNISCSKVPQTVLCISFDRTSVSTNGSFQDLGSGWPSHAVSVNQDRFLPWCMTRNDGGNLLIDYLGPPSVYDLSWGFCTSKARLPGVGFEYEPKVLDLLRTTLEEISGEFQLRNLPGCSNIPLVVLQNSAGRYVYQFNLKESVLRTKQGQIERVFLSGMGAEYITECAIQLIEYIPVVSGWG
jgi:hypothetical protein